MGITKLFTSDLVSFFILTVMSYLCQDIAPALWKACFSGIEIRPGREQMLFPAFAVPTLLRLRSTRLEERDSWRVQPKERQK